MKKQSRMVAILALFLGAALPALAEVETFTFDKAHTLIGFRLRHCVTKTVTVPVKHGGFLAVRGRSGMGEKTGFEIYFPLNRKDFGISWNRPLDQGGFMLSDDVDINVQIEANKQMPEAPKPAAPPAA